MLTTTNKRVLDTLKTWLLQLEANASVESIDNNQDLVNTGVIDSLEFVSFLLLIEELRGAEIPSFEMELDKFKTLNSIVKNFF